MEIFTGACLELPWPTDSTYHEPAADRIAASYLTMLELIIHVPLAIKAQIRIDMVKLLG